MRPLCRAVSVVWPRRFRQRRARESHIQHAGLLSHPKLRRRSVAITAILTHVGAEEGVIPS